MMMLVIALVWSGKGQGQDGTASMIIGSISGYWLGPADNDKQK